MDRHPDCIRLAGGHLHSSGGHATLCHCPSLILSQAPRAKRGCGRIGMWTRSYAVGTGGLLQPSCCPRATSSPAPNTNANSPVPPPTHHHHLFRPTAHLLQGCLTVRAYHWIVGSAALDRPHRQSPTAPVGRAQDQQFVMTAAIKTNKVSGRASEWPRSVPLHTARSAVGLPLQGVQACFKTE